MSEIAPALQLAWQIAAYEAAYASHECIEPVHLFIALCKLEDFTDSAHLGQLGLVPEAIPGIQAEIRAFGTLLTQFGLHPKDLRRELRSRSGKGSASRSRSDVIHRSPESRNVFAYASSYAEQSGAASVSIFHLLLGLLERPGHVSRLLREKGVDTASFATTVRKHAAPAEAGPHDPRKQAADSPILARYGKDLTELAREGRIQAAVGRKQEMLQVVRTLSRVTKNNPLLVGDPGVGKTAIVEGVAWRIASGTVPDSLHSKRIIQIAIADLVAGTSYRGEFEERVQALVREVAAAPDIILFIDEIHTIVGAGRVEGGSLDAANILKPALARGELRCIGATTTAEYHRYIEKDSALERRFQPIRVNETTAAETLDILQDVQRRFSEQHQVRITAEALQAAVSLATRYLPDRRLPDKAIDLLDEACARTQVSSLTISPDAPARGGGIVTEVTVAEVVAEWTGIPVGQLTEGERSRLLRMAESLKEHVIGQDEAVNAVATAVQRAYAGLKAAGRPIAVLLFLGPTGVGKTELAKATARFLFGSERAMVRLDMSEFMEQYSTSRLIGAPTGYVGYEDEGQLTGALRRKPFSVVLLDEIEKAHPDVLNLFLQLFDEGRLTDAKGRTVDGANCLFILTSNLGFARPVTGSLDDPRMVPGQHPAVRALDGHLRPELINRIDGIIVFQPLHFEQTIQIAALMLRDLGARLSDQGIALSVAELALRHLARLGYDEHYGARQLRRVIEKHVENPLGGMLLRGEVAAGDVIIVDADQVGVVLRVQPTLAG